MLNITVYNKTTVQQIYILQTGKYITGISARYTKGQIIFLYSQFIF